MVLCVDAVARQSLSHPLLSASCQADAACQTDGASVTQATLFSSHRGLSVRTVKNLLQPFKAVDGCTLFIGLINSPLTTQWLNGKTQFSVSFLLIGCCICYVRRNERVAPNLIPFPHLKSLWFPGEFKGTLYDTTLNKTHRTKVFYVVSYVSSIVAKPWLSTAQSRIMLPSMWCEQEPCLSGFFSGWSTFCCSGHFSVNWKMFFLYWFL